MPIPRGAPLPLLALWQLALTPARSCKEALEAFGRAQWEGRRMARKRGNGSASGLIFPGMHDEAPPRTSGVGSAVPMLYAGLDDDAADGAGGDWSPAKVRCRWDAATARVCADDALVQSFAPPSQGIISPRLRSARSS